MVMTLLNLGIDVWYIRKLLRKSVNKCVNGKCIVLIVFCCNVYYSSCATYVCNERERYNKQ